MSDDVCRSYVVGLGANLGDRVATLRSAVIALEAHGAVLAISDLYETSAIGPPQPDYLNAAVLLQSTLAPTRVLRALLDVEQGHGRERRERWGARTLDLDLLHSPELVLSEPELTLPHPELRHRAFALAPLVDVLPDAVDPVSGARFADLLSHAGSAGVRRFAARATWDPRPDS